MEKKETYLLPDDLVFEYVPSPGEIIRDELEARGWAQQDLANIMDRPIQAINEIINAKKEITTETAIELGAAFGTSAELWLNLENDYRLWLEKQEVEKKETEKIRRRSRIYELMPVRKIQKLGWIKKTNDIDQLEKEVCHFFKLDDLFSEPQLCVSNFRLSVDRGVEEMSVRTWVRRVEQITEEMDKNNFNSSKFDAMVDELLDLSYDAANVASVPSTLAKYGINFVLLEHLPQTYIDGGAFWIQNNPVIVLTLRYDRIDSFWFTLMHELGHIKFSHEGHIDDLSNPDEMSNNDEIANKWAMEKLIDQNAFEAFIKNNQPRYSKQAIEDFALRIHRHPGIIVGQLQHRKEINYSTMRMYLVKVKDHLQP